MVASPQEIALIRNRCGKTFEIVTPGIRGASDDKADQRRTMTAAEALSAGASYLVVGRPIITAADPRAAAERIDAECRAASDKRSVVRARRGASAIIKTSMIALTIYSRPGCHLCDDMKAVVRSVARTVPLSLDEVDISTDPALEAQYGLEIPVLMVEGTKAAKYRIGEEELRRLLAGRAGRTG